MPLKDGQIHWPSVIQFGLSALAIFCLWGGALLFATMGVFGFIVREAHDPVFIDPLQLFLMVAVTMAIGFLLLPSAYYALWRVLGWHAVDLRPALVRFKPALWIVALPAVLLSGYWVSNISGLAWLVLPPLHLLAVGLPVAWVLYLTVHGLPLGSPQRMWGVFSSGLMLAPMVALMLEGLAGLGFLLLGVLYISTRPDLVEQLSRLAQWVSITKPTPELLVERVSPLLVRPVAIFSVLILGAMIVPLIEEALKPIGVWLLAGRSLSPAAGFTAGAMSGAAYALFESLMLTGNGQQWVSMIVARIGTAIIHIFTTGLIGWALVQVWHKRGYTLLGASYLVAVLIHGLWNALTLFATFSALASLQGLQSEISFIFKLGQVAPFGLVFLAVGTFVTLLYANRSLGRS